LTHEPAIGDRVEVGVPRSRCLIESDFDGVAASDDVFFPEGRSPEASEVPRQLVEHGSQFALGVISEREGEQAGSVELRHECGHFGFEMPASGTLASRAHSIAACLEGQAGLPVCLQEYLRRVAAEPDVLGTLQEGGVLGKSKRYEDGFSSSGVAVKKSNLSLGHLECLCNCF